MICIYHSRDLDGYTSGAIVKKKFPEAILIGFDYGQELPYDKIPKYEPIIMIDVSLPMPEMQKLASHSGGQLTWIDHHVSAIKDFEFSNGGRFLTPVLYNGLAACELGWQHLFPNEPMPRAVELLGKYDTWRNQDIVEWENEILPFQFGMRQLCQSPETFPEYLFDNRNRDVDTIIRNGKTILEYQRQQNERACRSAFEFEFEGLRAICLNGGGFNSDVFKSVYDESKHDLMMPFMWNGKKWTFSLYTTKEDIDCSVIAKKRGGGGHKKAAGFTTQSLQDVFTN